MADREDSGPAVKGMPKRRRRRQQAPIEEVAPQVETSALGKQVEYRVEDPHLSRWQRWKREVLPSLGLSPTFRAYIFVGSILGILVFLLYTESLIGELRDQEKSNVDLYARLISLSAQATDAQSIAIFQEVTINPNINFPMIVTDHRGKIIHWKGVELPMPADSTGIVEQLWRRLAFWKEGVSTRSDTSAMTMEILHRLVGEMDAKNEPLSFFQFSKVPGYLYNSETTWVITDGQGEIVEWGGAALPASTDTTVVARAQVETFVREADAENAPLVFNAAVDAFSYLYYDGANAVITDNQLKVVAWRGAALPSMSDTTAAVRARVRAFWQEMSEGHEPLAFEIPAKHYIHYGDSELVDRVSRGSLVLTGTLLLFLLVGYIGFRNIKRSEQRSIWVGMAKETAHQLGTPLSSLSGWLELIRNEIEADPERRQDLARIDQMAGEMQRDMQRLTQIASRFSQIGSVPELRKADVVAILEETVAYFNSRGPQFGRHEIRVECHDEVPLIPLNADLIGWVFENLFKNAIDAIEHENGHIEIGVGLLSEQQAVQITFQDNGRGIEPENVNRIFDPGFSTKKRGWGLGLAFVQRIVEEYHDGRISVVQSVPGEGATFEVLLPLGS